MQSAAAACNLWDCTHNCCVFFVDKQWYGLWIAIVFFVDKQWYGLWITIVFVVDKQYGLWIAIVFVVDKQWFVDDLFFVDIWHVDIYFVKE